MIVAASTDDGQSMDEDVAARLLTLPGQVDGTARPAVAPEAQRNEKRRSLFDAQDRVDIQRDELILAIEGKLVQSAKTERLFAIRWVLQ